MKRSRKDKFVFVFYQPEITTQRSCSQVLIVNFMFAEIPKLCCFHLFIQSLVIRFLKRAAKNLRQEFKVIIPSHKLPLQDRWVHLAIVFFKCFLSHSSHFHFQLYLCLFMLLNSALIRVGILKYIKLYWMSRWHCWKFHSLS